MRDEASGSAIYQAIGIPVNMFTVMFTLGRLPGWVARSTWLVPDGQTAPRV